MFLGIVTKGLCSASLRCADIYVEFAQICETKRRQEKSLATVVTNIGTISRNMHTYQF